MEAECTKSRHFHRKHQFFSGSDTTPPQTLPIVSKVFQASNHTHLLTSSSSLNSFQYVNTYLVHTCRLPTCRATIAIFHEWSHKSVTILSDCLRRLWQGSYDVALYLHRVLFDSSCKCYFFVFTGAESGRIPAKDGRRGGQWDFDF